MNKEAAIITTGIAGLATAIIGLLVAFGADITDDQRNAILGTLAASCIVIFTIGPIIRAYVWSQDSVEEAVTDAYLATPGIDPKPEV